MPSPERSGLWTEAETVVCEHQAVQVRGGFLSNGAMLRALLSFGAAFTAEWAFTVAIGLVAFADGGTVAVGLVGLLRLVPPHCSPR